MRRVVPFAIGLVFLGCCANVIFLELIIKEEPTAGNIITFFQFLFIALEGLIFVSRKPVMIPMKSYMSLVAFFFVSSVLNNFSLRFDIPLPLHMIFRAGSLMANMVLGILLLKKSYSWSKYIAVVLISVGITMATLASAYQKMSGDGMITAEEDSIFSRAKLAIGIVILISALFVSARMGIFQEVLYREHGKHPREAMFYMHALPLPGFLLMGFDIWNKIILFNASEPFLFLGVVSIPKMWLYILGNCITQYVCIRGVFILTTECPSLIVTLVVTLRKFVSVLFSIYYFKNPFTLYHWVATAMVFSGTLLFTGIINSLIEGVVQTNGCVASKKKVN